MNEYQRSLVLYSSKVQKYTYKQDSIDGGLNPYSPHSRGSAVSVRLPGPSSIHSFYFLSFPCSSFCHLCMMTVCCECSSGEIIIQRTEGVSRSILYSCENQDPVGALLVTNYRVVFIPNIRSPTDGVSFSIWLWVAEFTAALKIELSLCHICKKCSYVSVFF